MTLNLTQARLDVMRSKDEQQDPIGSSDYKELQILSEVERTAEVTQRQLSQRVGISLGLTNALFRNLVKKGYVRGVEASWKRWVYALTPKGFTHKIQLTFRYISRVLDHYQQVRQTLRVEMESLAFHEESRVAIYGTGDFAELVYIGLKDFGITEIDIFSSDSPNGRTFLGMPVRSVESSDFSEYDRVIVASLDGPETDVTDLEKQGITADKRIVFFSGFTSTRHE